MLRIGRFLYYSISAVSGLCKGLSMFYDKVGLHAGESFSSSSLPSLETEPLSDDIISFSGVDIITPAQKVMARQLNCDIVAGKSLLVTVWWIALL